MHDLYARPADGLYFSTFIVGQPNEMAFRACEMIAEKPSTPSFNPLFIHGPVGCGKSHLLNALAHVFQRAFSEQGIMCSGADFAMHTINAAKRKNLGDLLEMLIAAPFLFIDDLQSLDGKLITQHSLSSLIESRHRLGRISAFTSSVHPNHWENIEPGLMSRLNSGMAAAVFYPTHDMRTTIIGDMMRRATDEHGAVVHHDVVGALALRDSMDLRVVNGAIQKLMLYALTAEPEIITVSVAEHVLADLLNAEPRVITITEIMRFVGAKMGCTVEAMKSPRRAIAFARPRQVAMWCAKALTTKSLPEIGRMFGNRDHTTVIHAVRKIDELRKSDDEFRRETDLIIGAMAAGKLSRAA